MNVVDVWLAYQGITRTTDTQADFHNYYAEEMIDNTYDRFMMRGAEGRRRTIVDSDEETSDDYSPQFGRINYSPRLVIALHVTPTKKTRNKRNGKETQYWIQGECKVFRKNMTHVYMDCADTNAVKNEMWVCHLKTNRSFFAQHIHRSHDL